MSLIFRLAGQRGASQFLKNNAGLINCVRPVTIKASKVTLPAEEGHDERNMKLKRPQSPHLTIYKPQLTAILSISHRATGMVLAAYTVGLGLAGIVAPEAVPNYIDCLHDVSPTIVQFIKFSLAFPMCYHFWNGIRHLIWDTGKFLTISGVYNTGYLMLLITFLSAGYLTFV
ncbi:unnamed protein product [Phyllotreta striolata]|uniref:Succinate dehydrogenase cytochrome b560 subunit, mitochondrial n=1 Tax=Phyllotreta striolata TaxID=444603 RepID=A0A9N9TR10_PHYSR|nr:unnamed protein product [Phyllotreta striolata]